MIAEMIIENKEMGIRFAVDNQQDFDKWYAIRKEQIRADAINEFADKIKEYSDVHYLDCDGYYGGQTELVFRTEEFLDDILENLKE